MKHVPFSVMVILALLSLSFRAGPDSGEIDPTGVYGINVNCGYEIELTLKKDRTFHYKNTVDSDNLIDVTGNWTLKNNKVVLMDYDTGSNIPHRWKVSKNQKCLKSNLTGFQVTTLCLEGC